jgi:sulfoacetaldehyde acetyltransferase
MKMTTEEAFVKVLQMHGIEHAFGIIGSAFMPISDLFPKAGITFWDCAHEGSGGMMADGYTRASGKMCMMIAQNGPGITNFVTAVKTAYWNHTPLASCHAAGGEQDHRDGRVPGSRADGAVPGHGRLSGGGARSVARGRSAEPLHPERPSDERPGPDQHAARLLDAGDRHRAACVVEFERPSGGEAAIAQAAAAFVSGEVPGDPERRGRGSVGAIPASMALAERLDAPVCVGYQHNDAFPGSHPLFAGPLGYNGSKAGMELISGADVVLCSGYPAEPVFNASGIRAGLLAEGRPRSSKSTSTRIGSG